MLGALKNSKISSELLVLGNSFLKQGVLGENSNLYQTVQIGSDLKLLFIEENRILIQAIATSNPDQLRSDLEAIELENSVQSDFVVSG